MFRIVLSSFAAVLMACVCLASLCSAEEGLALKWGYDASGTVWALGAGDVNGDGVSEVAYAAANGVSVLDASGSPLKSFPLGFNATCLYLSDLDGDGKEEILAGSGYLNESTVNGSRFDLTDPAKFREKESYLYKIMRSQGDVYVLDWDSREPVKKYEVGEWVRGIYVEDVDDDGRAEILAASGGSGINYIEKLTTGIDNMTGNLTYIRNRTETYLQNGSVSIFLTNGSLKNRYRTNVPVNSIYALAFDNRTIKTILAGTSAILVLNGNATLMSTIKPLRGNASIVDIDAGDLTGEGTKEILASFVEPVVSGVYAMDRAGKLLWEYRLPSKNVLSVFYVNIDTDDAKEIVAVSQEGIFVLNVDGKVVRSTRLKGGVERTYVKDLQDDPYVDFIASYRSRISAYEVDESFIKAQSAEKYFSEAEKNYRLANYQAAVGNVTAARSLYEELGDAQGVAKAQALSDKIEQELRKIKKDAADSLYGKAESQFYYRKYAEARDLFQKAKEVYLQIGDDEGVSKSDARIAETEGLISSQTASSTSVPANQGASTTTIPRGGQGFSWSAYVVLGLIILALLAYALNLGRKMKTGKNVGGGAGKKED